MKFAAHLAGALAVVSLPGAAMANSFDSIDQARLVGKIEDRSARVTIADTPPALGDSWSDSAVPGISTVTLDDEGRFSLPIDLDDPEFRRISVGTQSFEVYLQPGYALTVSLSDDGPRFSGEGSEANAYLHASSNALRSASRQLFSDSNDFLTGDLADFQAAIAPVRAQLLADHNAAVARSAHVPPELAERIRADIVYWFKDIELNYPRLHHELTGQPAQVAEGYLDAIAADHLDQSQFLMSRRYIDFLDAYVRLKSSGELALLKGSLPKEKLLSRYVALRDLPLSADLRDHLLGEMFRNFTISYGPRDWGRVLEVFEVDRPNHPIALRYRPILDKAMARRGEPDDIVVYKTIDGHALEAHIFYPESQPVTGKPSAYLFFHGGGWAIGTPEWGYGNARRMAERGMIAVSFEYRLADVHGTPIFAALEDARSAIGWARANLPIDPERVVAAGFSAGGHIAAGSAIFEFPEFGGAETRPNALVIQSSSYDTTKSRFFDAMTGSREEEASLTHRIGPDLVPTLLLHGRYDRIAPLAEFQAFAARMGEEDNDFEYHVYGVGHFFRDAEVNKAVAATTDAFLVRRGFLSPE